MTAPEKKFRFVRLALLPALFGGLLVACSASNDRGQIAVRGTPAQETGTGLEPAPEETGLSFDDADLVAPVEDSMTAETACATAQVAAIKKPVDIIMVIDQSGSMNEEIEQVKANINRLGKYLDSTNLDYRLVMIAGLPGNGSLPVCVPPPLGGPSCQSKPPRFRAVNEHVESWDALKLVLQTYDSTDPSKKWADFLRQDAIKVFIPVTDDDATDVFLPRPVAESFDAEILKRGKGTFGTRGARKYVFYPIIGVEKGSTNRCSTAVNNGPVYLDLVKLTKGQAFSVCETDYAPVFAAIGKSIATSVACEVAIPEPPENETFDPEKVNVVFTDSTETTTILPKDDTSGCFEGANGWQYDETKTRILLCGDACATARSDPSAKIDVQFGCATRGPT